MFETKNGWKGTEAANGAILDEINISSVVSTVRVFRVVRGSNPCPDANPGGKSQFPGFCFFAGLRFRIRWNRLASNGLPRSPAESGCRHFPDFPGISRGV